MHRYKILVKTPQRVKQYHRRTYASICICMHTHTYIHIHICAPPAASVFADVYVGVKTHLCNINTCACTSAQNTCKVHVTLTAKKMHKYIYLWHICIRMHMHTKTHAHAWHRPHAEALKSRPTIYAQICIHMHTHVYKRIDVQIHTHMHIYTYKHVSAHTHIHKYTHTHTKCTYELHAKTPGTTARQRTCNSRCRPRKLCTSLSFDAIKPHLAPPKHGLHCTHVLQH